MSLLHLRHPIILVWYELKIIQHRSRPYYSLRRSMYLKLGVSFCICNKITVLLLNSEQSLARVFPYESAMKLINGVTSEAQKTTYHGVWGFAGVKKHTFSMRAALLIFFLKEQEILPMLFRVIKYYNNRYCFIMQFIIRQAI